MGGHGSTRWGWHTKKTTVEDCHKLTIHDLKGYLFPYGRGGLSWTYGGRPSGNISFMTTGVDDPVSIRLIYTITDRASGEVTNYDYPVPLTYTLTPWGARRYWFTCPECGRRAGALYLAPGRRFFRCRLCCNLTYRSCQESRQFDGLYNLLALGMQGSNPGLTGRDVKAILDGKPPRRMTPYLARQLAEYQEMIDNLPDPYARYLTPGDLCNQSGLTPDNLAALEGARLLIPDHGGKYRPKLAGWGRKLAHLIGEGWTLAELQAWARGRWSTPNPRAWPPDRAEWSAKNG